ncbi:MAG: sensor histidine kinase [Dehalococcoidia bacterium]
MSLNLALGLLAGLVLLDIFLVFLARRFASWTEDLASWRRWQKISNLSRFVHELQDISKPETVRRSLVDLLSQAVKAKRAYLLSPALGRRTGVEVYASGEPEAIQVPLTWQNPLIRWLGFQQKVVTFRELAPLPEWQGLPAGEQEVFGRLGGELFIALGSQDEPVSVLILSARTNGKPYSRKQIQVIEMATSHVRAVMESTRLSEQLRMQLKELEQTREQLIRSAKLAAIGELASSVAHEVNNPLQSIMNLTYLLAQGELPEAVREDMQLIDQEVQRARGILRSLLEFSRQDEPVWGREEVNGALLSVVELAKVRTESSGVEVETLLDATLPLVWGDGEQLRQLFLNLVTNALDAMPSGGTLTVATRQQNGGVEVEISDTGIGISKKQLQRIFDPFYTTKPPGKGTGLGLTVSQRIVERHGGALAVRSVVDQGTTFTITLPALPGSTKGERDGQREHSLSRG